jgi:hypothetical protein
VTLAGPRRLRALLALTLLTIAGLSLAGPAQANVRDFRLGVTATEIRDGDIEAMGDAGVETLRTTLLWDRVEIARGDGRSCGAVYNWSHYDQLFAKARREGIRVLPILIGSPGYAAAAVARTPRPGAVDDYVPPSSSTGAAACSQPSVPRIRSPPGRSGTSRISGYTLAARTRGGTRSSSRCRIALSRGSIHVPR